MRFLLLILHGLLSVALPLALPAADTTTSTTVEQPQSTAVWITRTGKRYHRESCRYANIKSSLGEARQRGLTPCKVCNP